MKDAKIGNNVSLGFGSILIGKSIAIGNNTTIGAFVIIQGDTITIGNNVKIGSLTFIKSLNIVIGNFTILRENIRIGGLESGKSEIDIRNHCHIHQNCLINSTFPVIIDDYTAIGSGSNILTHSSWQSILDGYPCTFKPVVIGKNVWVALNVTIMPGVVIGEGSLIAACSCVTKSIPERCLASGNPAKVQIPSGMFPRQLIEDDKKKIIDSILDDYIHFLNVHAIDTSDIKHVNFRKIEIRKLKSSRKVVVFNYYFLYKNNLLQQIENDSFIMGLYFDPSVRFDFFQKRIPWIDFATNEKDGSNEYIEELLGFLKHYGIKPNQI